MRLLLIAALVALLSADVARADTGSITINSAIGDRASATFTFTKTTCATTYYCGWFVYATRQLASQPCSTLTPVWVDVVREGLITTTGTAEFYSFAGEGPHRLCLFVYENGADRLVAEVVYAQQAAPAPPQPQPTPTPTPTVAPPSLPAAPTTISTARIPRWIGRRDRSADTLAIFAARVPYGVDRDRFVELVRAVAQRWDIYTGGVSRRTFRFARPDGRNGIGFRPLEAGTLGTTRTWSARVYRRYRSCRMTAAGRRCRIKRRYVGRRVVERDVALDTRTNWQPGPDYPAPDEYDLETAIIHELGHWAGNRHADECDESPMVPALDAGEWWRDPTDFHYAGCGLTASAARASRALRHTRRSVEVELPPDVAADAAGVYARVRWARDAVARAVRG